MTNTVTQRGLTAGEGTNYPFTVAPTLPGSLSRQPTVELASGGSAFVGGDVGSAGTLLFEHAVLGATQAEAMTRVDAIVAAWSPDTDAALEELTLVLADVARIYRGRPRRATPKLDLLIRGNMAEVQCEFTVADPRWYAGITRSVTVGVAAMTGGLATPVDTTGGVTTTSSGSSGDVSVVNAGTAPAPWTAYIVGPVTTPRLIMAGKTFELLGDVPAGSTLVVDSYNGTIRLDGAARPWKSFESTWWEIPPGTSTFSFRALAGTGTATLIWQDAST